MQLNKLENRLSFKGQQNSCPLLFMLLFLTLAAACNKKTTPTVKIDPVSEIYPVPEADQTSQADTLETESPQFPTEDFKKTRFKTFVDQAKESDISTPVGYELIKSDSKIQGISFLVYKGESSPDSVINFYIQELERSGWSFKNLSTKQEGLFVASKVSKTGVISIRPQKLGGSKICITISDENQQEDQSDQAGETNDASV
jgi:hypothetical protein